MTICGFKIFYGCVGRVRILHSVFIYLSSFCVIVIQLSNFYRALEIKFWERKLSALVLVL